MNNILIIITHNILLLVFFLVFVHLQQIGRVIFHGVGRELIRRQGEAFLQGQGFDTGDNDRSVVEQEDGAVVASEGGVNELTTLLGTFDVALGCFRGWFHDAQDAGGLYDVVHADMGKLCGCQINHSLLI